MTRPRVMVIDPARVSLESMRSIAPNADVASRGMLAACEGIARGRTGAWRTSRPGLRALMTTVPGRPYNGLYGIEATAVPDDAVALARDLAKSGVSWCARLRPGTPADVEDALNGEGLAIEDEALLMATSKVVVDFEGSRSSELTLRTRLPSDDLAISVVLSAVFETPRTNATKLLDPNHLACAGIQWHIGEARGVPVTCAMSVVARDAVSLFAVGTVPEARGRGYASAVTSSALAHGFAAGARFGVLTASPEVQGVYERLGFQVLESWRRLVPQQ